MEKAAEMAAAVSTNTVTSANLPPSSHPVNSLPVEAKFDFDFSQVNLSQSIAPISVAPNKAANSVSASKPIAVLATSPLALKMVPTVILASCPHHPNPLTVTSDGKATDLFGATPFDAASSPETVGPKVLKGSQKPVLRENKQTEMATKSEPVELVPSKANQELVTDFLTGYLPTNSSKNSVLKSNLKTKSKLVKKYEVVESDDDVDGLLVPGYEDESELAPVKDSLFKMKKGKKVSFIFCQ